jgi:hypothetical protein
MRCKQGDLAIVEESIDGLSVGKIVQVVKYIGEHSQYGPIWRCRGKDQLVTEYGAVGQTADFADSWLRPIRPDNTKEETEETVSDDDVVVEQN